MLNIEDLKSYQPFVANFEKLKELMTVTRFKPFLIWLNNETADFKFLTTDEGAESRLHLSENANPDDTVDLGFVPEVLFVDTGISVEDQNLILVTHESHVSDAIDIEKKLVEVLSKTDTNISIIIKEGVQLISANLIETENNIVFQNTLNPHLMPVDIDELVGEDISDENVSLAYCGFVISKEHDKFNVSLEKLENGDYRIDIKRKDIEVEAYSDAVVDFYLARSNPEPVVPIDISDDLNMIARAVEQYQNDTIYIYRINHKSQQMNDTVMISRDNACNPSALMTVIKDYVINSGLYPTDDEFVNALDKVHERLAEVDSTYTPKVETTEEEIPEEFKNCDSAEPDNMPEAYETDPEGDYVSP